MLKLITILIGCSLSLGSIARAEKPDKDAGKKPKNQKQQVVAAPKQHQMHAPKTQVQKMPNQHVNKSVVNTRNTEVPKNELRRMTPVPTHTPASVQSAKVQKNKTQFENVKKPKPLEIDSTRQTPVVTNNNPQLQANNQQFKKNKLNQQQIQQIRAQHRNFKAQRNSSIASAQFNQNYQIRNAQNWSGSNYQVFRSYRPQWHDRSWWHSHHSHLSLIGGGWYFWNAGYWYPAWGYDNSYSYYPYDGPIYSGPSARPFDQVVADVQAVLQEQGYYRGEVDGLLGPLTRQALADYQSSHGLYVTETIDRPTLNSIGLS